jgi:hypothetical protein
MRARGARAPARAIVQLIFPTSITDKRLFHFSRTMALRKIV